MCVCSMKHVPGFIEKADELKSKGVEEILCLSGMPPLKTCLDHSIAANSV